MAGCKCRYCQARLKTNDAYMETIKNLKAYFCNKEHYLSYLDVLEEERKAKEREMEIKKELAKKAREEKEAAERVRIEKYKADKDKAYWLICEIIGRKEIINTALWKEWKEWNKVASNETIGHYLEENKTYLIGAISRIDDVELFRIKYLSAILKNKLGDYKVKAKEAEKPKIKVDETFYGFNSSNNNKRRSLADLEDEF